MTRNWPNWGVVLLLTAGAISCGAVTLESESEPQPSAQLAGWVDQVSCRFFTFPYRAYQTGLPLADFLADVAEVERTLVKGARDRVELLQAAPPPIPEAQQNGFVQRLSVALNELAAGSEARATAAESALNELRTGGAVTPATIQSIQSAGGPRFETVESVYRDYPEISQTVRQEC